MDILCSPTERRRGGVKNCYIPKTLGINTVRATLWNKFLSKLLFFRIYIVMKTNIYTIDMEEKNIISSI